MFFVRIIVLLYALAYIYCKGESIDLSFDPEVYLQTYGYLKKPLNLNIEAELTNAQDLTEAVLRFQEFYKISMTGVIDVQTLRVMKKPRCGMSDLDADSFVLHNASWTIGEVKWYFKNADRKLVNIATDAFSMWSKHANISFSYSVLEPNIIISFRKREHTFAIGNGTCKPAFDGKGNVLGHAYFPNKKNDLLEIHLDAEEEWNYDYKEDVSSEKMNFFWILIHEIGHTLGIHHSPDQKSIMFPIYSQHELVDRHDISKDDIEAIQKLYGVKELVNIDNVTPAIKTTTEINAVQDPSLGKNGSEDSGNGVDVYFPDLCNIQKIDTLLIVNHRMYILYKKWAWSLSLLGRGKITYDKPKLIHNFFPFLPKHFHKIKAAYQRPSGEIVLFVDSHIYMISYPSLKLLEHWPRSIKAALNIEPTESITAAINNNYGQTNIILKDGTLIEINECHFSPKRYSMVSDEFPGIPTKIETVFRFTNGDLFFLTHQKNYYQFNQFTNTLVSAGKFNIEMLNISCPRISMLEQLKVLLTKLLYIQKTNVFNEYEVEDEDEMEQNAHQ